MGVQKYLELQASTGSYGKYYGFFLTLVREFKWPSAIHGVAILKLKHGPVNTPYSCKSEYRSINARNTDSNCMSQAC